ncbi:unnamed protein product, partial [Discosporangium mesarthrocarpum]
MIGPLHISSCSPCRRCRQLGGLRRRQGRSTWKMEKGSGTPHRNGRDAGGKDAAENCEPIGLEVGASSKRRSTRVRLGAMLRKSRSALHTSRRSKKREKKGSGGGDGVTWGRVVDSDQSDGELGVCSGPDAVDSERGNREEISLSLDPKGSASLAMHFLMKPDDEEDNDLGGHAGMAGAGARVGRGAAVTAMEKKPAVAMRAAAATGAEVVTGAAATTGVRPREGGEEEGGNKKCGRVAATVGYNARGRGRAVSIG